MIPRYSTPEMDFIWSEENQYKQWIRVEIEALEAKKEVGIIPKSNIDFKYNIDKFIRECKKDEKTTKHDVASFINILEKHIGPDGKFLHYGMTSSDLVDTALALRIKNSIEIIENNIINLYKQLSNLSLRYEDAPIMGRTHGMLAEPMSLSLIFGLYQSEIDRHHDRLKELEKRICVGKLSGSVGSYTHINPQVEEIFLKNLGLCQPKITNQIIQRDRHAELFNFIALTGTTLEKLATQIRHYSRPEINEMAEGHGKGYKGSSSMPHKRNPIGCENICGLARLLRGYAITAMENNSLWHERDISHSSTERFLFPDAFGILNYMLTRIYGILENLVIKTDVMEKRVLKTSHTWQSQFHMLELIKDGMTRKEAHDKIQNNEYQTLENNDLGGYDNIVDYYLRHTSKILDRL
jgi:adenylosuccinate lyase